MPACPGLLLLGLCLPSFGVTEQALRASGYRMSMMFEESASFRRTDGDNLIGQVQVNVGVEKKQVTVLLIETCSNRKDLIRLLRREEPCRQLAKARFDCRLGPRRRRAEVRVCGPLLVLPGGESPTRMDAWCDLVESLARQRLTPGCQTGEGVPSSEDRSLAPVAFHHGAAVSRRHGTRGHPAVTHPLGSGWSRRSSWARPSGRSGPWPRVLAVGSGLGPQVAASRPPVPVTELRGTAYAYRLQLPPGHWRPRSQQALKDLNPLIDAWVTWPEKGAVLYVTVETAPAGASRDPDVYVESSLRPFREARDFQEYGRGPLPAFPGQGRWVHAAWTWDGARLEYQRALIVRGDRVLQVIAASTPARFAQVKAELDRILASLELPPDAPAR